MRRTSNGTQEIENIHLVWLTLVEALTEQVRVGRGTRSGTANQEEKEARQLPGIDGITGLVSRGGDVALNEIRRRDEIRYIVMAY
jgi:hypothetical protein